MSQKYNTGYVVVDSDPNSLLSLQITSHLIRLAIHENGKYIWRFVPENDASNRWVLLNIEGDALSLEGLRAYDFVRKSGNVSETVTGVKTFSDSVTLPRLNMYRSINTNSGISWFTPSYKAWQNYMSNSGVTTCGVNGNITAPSGELVTSWALRSFVEDNNGYGWTFEGGSNSAGTPRVVAEIKSIDGSARFLGDLTSEGTFIKKMTFAASGWARNIIEGINTAGADVFNIGLNGNGSTSQKAYIGYNAYHSSNNLQITPSGNVSIGTTTNIDRFNIGGRLRVIDNDIYLGSTSVNSNTDIGIRMTEYNSTSFSGFYTSYNGHTNRYSIWSNSANDSNIANDVRRFTIHRDTGNVIIGDLQTNAYKLSVDGSIKASEGNSSEWSEAYSWGDHADKNYLTAESEEVNVKVTTNTNTTIDLGYVLGNLCNMGSSNGATSYTITNAKAGGQARVRINATTEPTIQGATKITGSSFLANTDMYMEVRNNSARNEYWFEII